MSIHVKADILALLKTNGYSSYRLRKENIFGQKAIQKLRLGGLPSWNELDTICKLTNSKIEDLIEYLPDS